MNAISIIEHLRADANITQFCGPESIGFLSVPGRSPLPHITLAGAEGGDANYTFGSNLGGNVAYYNDSFVVYVASSGTEDQSDLEQCDEILGAIGESLKDLTIPGFKIMYLRYLRPARTDVEQRTTSDDILRMGHSYEYGVTKL